MKFVLKYNSHLSLIYLALIVLVVQRFPASCFPIGQTSVCQNISIIIELRQLAHLECKD